MALPGAGCHGLEAGFEDDDGPEASKCHTPPRAHNDVFTIIKDVGWMEELKHADACNAAYRPEALVDFHIGRAMSPIGQPSPPALGGRAGELEQVSRDDFADACSLLADTRQRLLDLALAVRHLSKASAGTSPGAALRESAAANGRETEQADTLRRVCDLECALAAVTASANQSRKDFEAAEGRLQRLGDLVQGASSVSQRREDFDVLEEKLRRLDDLVQSERKSHDEHHAALEQRLDLVDALNAGLTSEVQTLSGSLESMQAKHAGQDQVDPRVEKQVRDLHDQFGNHDISLAGVNRQLVDLGVQVRSQAGAGAVNRQQLHDLGARVQQLHDLSARMQAQSESWNCGRLALERRVSLLEAAQVTRSALVAARSPKRSATGSTLRAHTAMHSDIRQWIRCSDPASRTRPPGEDQADFSI